MILSSKRLFAGVAMVVAGWRKPALAQFNFESGNTEGSRTERSAQSREDPHRAWCDVPRPVTIVAGVDDCVSRSTPTAAITRLQRFAVCPCRTPRVRQGRG